MQAKPLLIKRNSIIPAGGVIPGLRQGCGFRYNESSVSSHSLLQRDLLLLVSDEMGVPEKLSVERVLEFCHGTNL